MNGLECTRAKSLDCACPEAPNTLCANLSFAAGIGGMRFEGAKARGMTHYWARERGFKDVPYAMAGGRAPKARKNAPGVGGTPQKKAA